MKKVFFRVGIVILLAIGVAMISPKSTFATTIKSIEITVPEPEIGKKLTTDTSKIEVKVDDEQKPTIKEFGWYCDKIDVTGGYLNNYEIITDSNKICNKTDKYKLNLSLLFPLDSQDFDVSVVINGKKLNKNKDYTMGEAIIDDVNYQLVDITYEFGNAKIQKEISKIEITTPTPIVGKKLDTDISHYQVKIDGTENLNIEKVEWLSEDYKVLDSDIAEDGKKYINSINFQIPNKYGMSSNVIITVNGEQLYFENMNSEEFNYAASGNENYDNASVSKLMEAKKEEIKENEQNRENKVDNEEVKQNNEEVKNTDNQTKLKNPKTGDTITKSLIIFVISILGIAFTVNSIKKQNK